MSPQLPNAVAELIEAVNSGDTDAFLRAFKPDGTVDGDTASEMKIRA